MESAFTDSRDSINNRTGTLTKASIQQGGFQKDSEHQSWEEVNVWDVEKKEAG